MGRGASIDGEDQVFKPSGDSPFGKCGSNLLSGAGYAQLRGQAQVVVALDSLRIARRDMCNRRAPSKPADRR